MFIHGGREREHEVGHWETQTTTPRDPSYFFAEIAFILAAASFNASSTLPLTDFDAGHSATQKA